MRGLGSYKASEPDGFQAIFFKKAWHLVGEAVIHFVKVVMEEGESPGAAAEATLVLIPKEANLATMCGFRPLNLCNVSVKII